MEFPRGQLSNVTVFTVTINDVADVVGPSFMTLMYIDDITMLYGSSSLNMHEHLLLVVIN
jgi:hypothetical protein